MFLKRMPAEILIDTILEQKCPFFCPKMVYCGIWDRCFVGFVRLVYWYPLQWYHGFGLYILKWYTIHVHVYDIYLPIYIYISVGIYVFMMTSSKGNILRVTGPLCGEFTGHGEFPVQKLVTRSFNVFSDPCLNKRLSKQSWGLWFETSSCSLWRHCNGFEWYDQLLMCRLKLWEWRLQKPGIGYKWNMYFWPVWIEAYHTFLPK